MINKFKQHCIVGASIVFIVVIFVLVFVLSGWEYIKDGLKYLSTEWPRNVIIGFGAVVGLYIAYYRTGAMQIEANVTKKHYASEQFFQSVTLLVKYENSKPAIEARIGGIYALAMLAEANPKGYGAQVMKALVAYIRNNAQLTALPVPSKEDKDILTTNPEERSEAAHLGADVKTAFAELGRLHSNEKVRDESKVSSKNLSFSYTDFRTLRLNEVKWIGKPDLIWAKLQGANFRGAKLQGANLMWANLQDADLCGANLQGTYLNEANLQGTYLNRANLQGADLGLVNLQDADLIEANLQGAVFTFLQDESLIEDYLQRGVSVSANLRRANLMKANLQGADLSRANLQGANLMWANLQGADLSRANLQGANLIWANLQGADLSRVNLQGANLDNADLQDANLGGADLQGAGFRDANLQGAYLDDSDLLNEDSPWRKLDLIFLKTMELSDVVFILEGILRNFAEEWVNKPDPRSIECRKAVKQWVEEHNLWERLSDHWRKWLESLDNNYHVK